MSALNDPVWYISRDDDRRGPFSSDQFAQFEEAGTLRPTDQVWQTGMDAWIEYNDYVARKSVARLESPHRPSSSGPEENGLLVRMRNASHAPPDGSLCRTQESLSLVTE